ncbi:hypothetical protein EYZ11_011469 [Aspergillus tanneri]|nr:hypothetical protein EYZ11_011469 [Aspergillus tanneri]
MDRGKLFPSVTDGDRRTTILNHLLSTNGRILSLRSLLQDTLVLEPCAKALQQLVNPGCKDLKNALIRTIDGGYMVWPVQVTENSIKSLTAEPNSSPLLSQANYATIAYVQLWLFAMRHVENLSDINLTGSQRERNNETHVYRETLQESSY